MSNTAPISGPLVGDPRAGPEWPRPFPFGGDGSDGPVYFDGVATVLGMAPSSSVYTLTRDIVVTDMVVAAAATIKTANYRIFCTGTLTNLGTIQNNGNNGGNAAGNVAGAGGVATPVGFYPATIVGGNGGATGAAGSNGNAALGLANVCGTGASGHGGASTGAGGIAGTAGVALPAVAGSDRSISCCLENKAWIGTTTTSAGGYTLQCGPGAGGGGAGTSGTSAGGGGGASGGILGIFAPVVVNSGTISANGGNGGNGDVAGAAHGAVGGGAVGGRVNIITGLLVNTGTISANGGAIGVTGVQTSATAGSNGVVVITRV